MLGMQRSKFRSIVLILLVSMVPFEASAGTTVIVPPGFRLLHLSEGLEINGSLAINNAGDIVWHGRTNRLDANTSEIYRYSNGKVDRLTFDVVNDILPDINNHGAIVWSRQGPAIVHDIARLQNGALTLLTREDLAPDPSDNYDASINDSGVVVWRRVMGIVCGGTAEELWISNGSVSQQFTNVGNANRVPEINNLGQIVWNHTDFCASPWRFSIWGNTPSVGVVTDEFTWSQLPVIDDLGTISFGWRPPDNSTQIVQIRDGFETTLTADGWGPRTSSNGQFLAFSRWFDSNGTWQVVVVRGGVFEQITFGDQWNADPVLNDRGEVAWLSGISNDWQVRALVRLPTGDVNCDGVVSVSDIPAFVLALVDQTQYAETYPSCDVLLADITDDGTVSVSDIGGFVEALAGR